MFSPPHNIELAYMLRQVLVWSWRIFPFVYAAVVAAIFIRGRSACGRRVVWFGVFLLIIFGALAALLTVLGGFSAHGNSTYLKSIVILGMELVAPDVFSPWPGNQFPAAIALYSVLVYLAISCVRSRRSQSTNDNQHK
jgi:hypothetical protein